MMVINWERIGKIAGKCFLFFLEYCIKLSAFAVTGVVLAANGTFGTKLGTGFTSISPTLRGLFETPGEISDVAATIHEFNTMGADAFNEHHGAQAVHSVFAYLDGGIVYLQTVINNLASQPFATFFAAVISFWTLYMISLVLRFARQKGQGSYFNKLERKLSDRIYETSRKLTKPMPEVSSETKANGRPEFRTSSGIGNGTNGKTVSGSKNSSRAGKKIPNSFSKAQKTNKYLENYMKSVQNG